MQLPFNAFDYEPSQGAAICFPLADYRVQITGAEPKLVKDNTAAGYLELDLTIVEGQYRGMVQKHRLNLYNPSEVAKRIANQELSAICFAINRPYLQDSDQLLGGLFIATIGPQDDNPKYSEVKVVKCPDGTLPVKPAQGGMQPAPPAPPALPAPPAPPAAPAGWPQQTPAAPQWGQPPQAPAPPAAVPPGAPPSSPPWASAQPGAPPPASQPPWVR